MDAALLKTLGDLGIPLACVIVLAYVFLKGQVETRTEREKRDDAIAKLTENNTAALANNTQALTRLCDTTASTATDLAQHDERAQRIETTVTQIARVTDRIEQKLDAHAPAARGKTP